MHDAQSCARQHRHDGFGHHRHIDGHSVAGDQAQFGEGVGGPAHFVFELGVGDAPGFAERFALPVQRDPIAVAGLDMAVYAVVGDVDFAADEPFRHRGIGVVQNIGERGVPGQSVGLLGPERQPVCLGVTVEL